jgi:hypothetical protein
MGDYFSGLYFKCQSENETLAIIPAFHKRGGAKSCSVQLICDGGAWNFALPYERFRVFNGNFSFKIGENKFDSKGLTLSLETKECKAFGHLKFGRLSPIRYDIMGPFACVPYMECRHSVLSMKHSVNGEIYVNGRAYRFRDGLGYIEGDRGYSFPKRYAWTQCFFDKGSIMLSVADIPLLSFDFTGIICAIQYSGKEYRLATYLGAKAVKIKNGEIIIVQGDKSLEVRIIEKRGKPLYAPQNGDMKRIIHESASCIASYRFCENKRVIFEFESERSSFEYEYSE